MIVETELYPPLRRGRTPEVFDGERGDKIIDLIRQGLSPFAACREAGVSRDSFWRWMRLGGDPVTNSANVVPIEKATEPYKSFAVKVREAQRSAKPNTELLQRTLSPRGRMPHNISMENRKKILKFLRQGCSHRVACSRAGVRVTTFRSWLRWGGYPSQLSGSKPLPEHRWREPYITFVQAVLRVEEEVHSRDNISQNTDLHDTVQEEG